MQMRIDKFENLSHDDLNQVRVSTTLPSAFAVCDKIISELPSAESQWIPCSERLPEDGAWCLFTDGENMSVERYKADAIDAFFPTGRWFDLDDAVAWMPLPKPYKEEQP